MAQGGPFEIPVCYVDGLNGLAQGGDLIWGNSTHAPDDADGADHSHGELIAFRAQLQDTPVKNMTADNAGAWIIKHTPIAFQVCSHSVLYRKEFRVRN